jgi:ABC-type Mn2+/Zn2+ transport system ATPase subunit
MFAGIIGGNGSGKSTLFKMIMGLEQPDGGELTIGQTVVPMYVDQSRETLNNNNTVSDHHFTSSQCKCAISWPQVLWTHCPLLCVMLSIMLLCNVCLYNLSSHGQLMCLLAATLSIQATCLGL